MMTQENAALTAKHFSKIGPNDVTRRRPFRHAPQYEGTCWPTPEIGPATEFLDYLQRSAKQAYEPTLWTSSWHHEIRFINFPFDLNCWIWVNWNVCKWITFVCESRGLSKNMNIHALHWKSTLCIRQYATPTTSANVNNAFYKTHAPSRDEHQKCRPITDNWSTREIAKILMSVLNWHWLLPKSHVNAALPRDCRTTEHVKMHE